METVHNILSQIKETAKKKEKENILSVHQNHLNLRKILYYTYNPYWVYHVIKVPKVVQREELSEDFQWEKFFSLLDKLRSREIAGNAAVDAVHSLFCVCSEQNEKWMHKVLEKHLNVGITSKTINKAIKNLLPTFDVQLSNPYDIKRVKGVQHVAVEPKKDGNRCVALVENNTCKLFSRNGLHLDDSGKFNETITLDLLKLGDGMYDGEIFGNNFKDVMTQIRRKKNINVSGLKFYIWDWMPIEDWINQNTKITCREARKYLESLNINESCEHVKLIRRDIISPLQVDEYMAKYFNEGLTDEGIMVKLLDACYKFGRGYNIMKHKVFHADDLVVIGFEEGKTDSKYRGTLGAVIVDYNGVNVKVGSGFDDEEREEIWNSKEKYLGKLIEVKYQSVTDDKSLRHPVFVRWRLDKEER